MKKTIKIIDLYCKVASGEIIPLNIKHNGRKYYFCTSDNEYYDEEENRPTLLERISMGNVYAWLNSEVEILDEEEFEDIEEIDKYHGYQYSIIPPWFKDEQLIRSINQNFEVHQKAIYELIDLVNKLIKQGKK